MNPLLQRLAQCAADICSC